MKSRNPPSSTTLNRLRMTHLMNVPCFSAMLNANLAASSISPCSAQCLCQSKPLIESIAGKNGRKGLPQILLEPSGHVLQALLPVLGLAATAQLVVLAREPDELGGHPQHLEGCEELLSLLNRAPVVLLRVDDHGWGHHVLHIPDGALGHELLLHVPPVAAQLGLAEGPPDVAAPEEAYPIGDATEGDGRRKPVRVADDPVGHDAPVRAPG